MQYCITNLRNQKSKNYVFHVLSTVVDSPSHEISRLFLDLSHFTVADKGFLKDKEIVIEAIKQYDYIIKFVDESLRKDPDILAVVNKNKRM